MQILFAISILCFLALVWAGIALARHIRLNRRHDLALVQTRPDFSQHLFAAAEGAGVPSLHPARPQSSRDISAGKNWNSPSAAIQMESAFDSKATSPKRFWRERT